MATPKERFLEVYENEHAKTMRVLRAFPAHQSDLKPHPSSRSARELAWIFVGERALGTHVIKDNMFAKGPPPAGRTPPSAPESWEAVLAALEKAHTDFADVMRAIPDDQMDEPVKFFVAPKTLGDFSRIDFAWFLLHDQIHHRGQFSVYLRMAGGKVPSIYGPSGDEPWF